MYQAGLVLEGGGMKGAYTAGVLDFFLEKEIEFSSVYGVSAGAVHMCSYLSKQKGRSIRISTKYGADPRYCSLASLLLTGDLFNVKTCYDTVPNKWEPFDHKTYENYQGKAYAVVTNIETGKAEYLRVKECHEGLQKVRASASLPLVSRNVPIGDNLYLDGGMSDAIPIAKSVMDGNTKNVVVLTKEVGYVRKPTSKPGLLKLRYGKKYPKVVELMQNRHIVYNETLEYLKRLEESGKVFIIRPKKASDVGRLEKDAKKLQALYEEGYEDAKACLEDLIKFLMS
ncbi:MAG: patatin family protein [Lachnospiraceae bacterium]|nr:patatin family protein [Lachnospiraceae bacterium]